MNPFDAAMMMSLAVMLVACRVCYRAGYVKGHGDGFCQAHAGMQAAADAARGAQS